VDATGGCGACAGSEGSETVGGGRAITAAVVIIMVDGGVGFVRVRDLRIGKATAAVVNTVREVATEAFVVTAALATTDGRELPVDCIGALEGGDAAATGGVGDRDALVCVKLLKNLAADDNA